VHRLGRISCEGRKAGYQPGWVLREIRHDKKLLAYASGAKMYENI